MLTRLLLLAAIAPALPADLIQRAFERLYNFDFASAHAILDRHVAGRSDDPLGHSVRAERPDDPDALYALCVSHGVLVDYTALIDKKRLASLSQPKRSNACAQRLLKAHPQTYDAYVTVGFTEYLAGSLPFFVRWFVRFEGVEGDKQAGIRILHQAAQSGRYLGPFAKILLAVAYLREKKLPESRRWLAEFNQDYPENQLVRPELAKLSGRLAGGPAGQR
jgi:hypothetical protein